MARILAKAVNCEHPHDGNPCNECRNCLEISFGSSLDVYEIDAASNRGIEEIRALKESVRTLPSACRKKVYIIDEVHMLSTSAFNALLKTLEEPMPDRFLWLLSSNPGHLPQTIRSRCQKVEMPMPSHAEALAWLSTSGTSDVDAETALKAAKGHPVLALDWLQNGGMALRTRIQKDLDALAQSRTLPSEVAEAWMLEDPALCLRFAAELAVDRAAALPPSNESRALAAWFDAANRSRALLRTPIRPNLILTELLVDWCRRMVPLNKERHA